MSKQDICSNFFWKLWTLSSNSIRDGVIAWILPILPISCYKYYSLHEPMLSPPMATSPCHYHHNQNHNIMQPLLLSYYCHYYHYRSKGSGKIMQNFSFFFYDWTWWCAATDEISTCDIKWQKYGPLHFVVENYSTKFKF